MGTVRSSLSCSASGAAQFLRDAGDRRHLLGARVGEGSAVGAKLRQVAREHVVAIVGMPRERQVRELGVDPPQLREARDELAAQCARLGVVQLRVEAQEDLPRHDLIAFADGDLRHPAGIGRLDDLQARARRELACGHRDDVDAGRCDPCPTDRDQRAEPIQDAARQWRGRQFDEAQRPRQEIPGAPWAVGDDATSRRKASTRPAAIGLPARQLRRTGPA